jgi:exodeoxyribonuclease V gamma subunit
MPLSISFISRFEDVLEPARAFLSRDGDLFAKPRIVVPTAGAKAWLWSELAKTLGASRGDGIVANVEISYPGTILALLQPPRGREPDPWDFDRLTFTVLDVITGPAAAALGLPIEIGREPLSTARRIAGLFDEYHVRRPGMILEWERPEENPVLEPTANDVQHDGSAVPASLRDGDRWQFRLWREVRRRIGQPSPPARRGVEHDQSRQPLLIAGLQSLTLPQFECLEPLAAVCPVEAWLVHPSPGLRSRWSSAGQQPLPEDLRTRPLQKRRDPVFPAGVDPLLPVWLAGACELQDLLTARGAKVVEPLSAGDAAKGPAASLLHRLQRTIADGGRPEPLEHDPARDRSLLIHRCHSLSRQAEVLHDALLQAFADIPHLEPHDVVIVSPCLEKAAPHLQAVFQRTVRGLGRDDEPRSVKLPLVIADRGLRDTSPAAELLTALLAIPGSRASVDDVLTVAGHPLVRLAFAIDDDTVATWAAFVERTAVRWGLDSAHRRRHGLDLRHNTEIHTWRLGLERMLLGATLPDAAARPELGGVVPLEDLETADLARITKLVRILDILHGLEAAAVGSQPAAAWCDVIEQALVDLCGEECPQLAEPLAHLRRLRQAAAGTAGGRVSVPFADVRVLLTTWLDETTGRQPLRTGAITATSMVPLRSVPFKVICVMGYDDGTVAAGEADGDDLVGRQQLVGDVDPRVDVRRALLDCVVAAGARLVITCNGRNARSNKRVPLVTPLAELVDFAVRHGVHRDALDALSGIEIDHPRHHLSRRNFEERGVERTGCWSHDGIAREVLETIENNRRRQKESTAPQTEQPDAAAVRPESTRAAALAEAATARAALELTDLSLLERLVKDPLGLYLQETLDINAWRDEDEPTPATLPLTLPKRDARKLTTELLGVVFGQDAAAAAAATAAWVEAKRASGILPLGPHVQRQVDEIVALAAGLAAGLRDNDLDLHALRSQNLADVNQLGRFRVVGSLPGIHANPDQLVVVTAATAGGDDYDRPLHRAALHLLVARAAGVAADRVTIVSRHGEWQVGKLKPPSERNPAPRPADSWQARVVKLAPALMPPAEAARRLDAIVALVHEAIREPRPAFGKVLTQEAAGREEEFQKAVEGDFYWRSSECALFGVSPSFEQVFTDHPERVRFLDTFQQLLAPAYDRASRTYVLQ